jgi:hypothetical protein
VRSQTILAVQTNVPGPTKAKFTVGKVTAGGARGFQQVLIGVTNTGNAMAKPTGSVTISDASGKQIQKIPFRMDTFLPKTTIDYPVVLKQGLPAGDYTAAVSLDYGTGTATAEPSFTVSKENVKQVFTSSTPFVFANFRTQLIDADDMANVEKVQTGYKAQPLSAFLKQPAPPAAPTIEFLPATTAGIKKNFFEYLDVALQFVPETSRDKVIRAKLARIGIGPGKTLEFKDLPLEHKAELLVGMKQGDDKIDKWLASGNKPINGWNVSSLLGDEAFYNGDWLLRSGAAKAGLYGNDAAEAMYPFTRTDASGKPLDGSKHKYTITFPPGQLPPVHSFWSVTMYDGKSQLLVKNPINRYLVNSPMLPGMKKDADGSLTLHIQKDSPGADKEANWLPAPDGTIYLVMRLYWPKTEAPSILPAGKGTWQPPGVKRVS